MSKKNILYDFKRPNKITEDVISRLKKKHVFNEKILKITKKIYFSNVLCN